jgi:hypothetical protein
LIEIAHAPVAGDPPVVEHWTFIRAKIRPVRPVGIVTENESPVISSSAAAVVLCPVASSYP